MDENADYIGKAHNSYMQAPVVVSDPDMMYEKPNDAVYCVYEFVTGKGSVREIVVKGNGELGYLEIMAEK
ncbi:MAG: hypothetical protein IJX87_05595 [Clostridia bacterium]|nr:hypothetical protein [Clostridia bacterium]